MHVNKHVVTISGTPGSTSSFYTGVINGAILAINYQPSTGTAISSTADLDITTETSGADVLTSLSVGASAFWKAPHMTVVNTTNGAIANASSPIPVANERLEISIINSSSTDQEGVFNVYSQGGK